MPREYSSVVRSSDLRRRCGGDAARDRRYLACIFYSTPLLTRRFVGTVFSTLVRSRWAEASPSRQGGSVQRRRAMFRIIEILGVVAPLAALVLLIVYRRAIPSPSLALGVIGCVLAALNVLIGFVGKRIVWFGSLDGRGLEEIGRAHV